MSEPGHRFSFWGNDDRRVGCASPTQTPHRSVLAAINAHGPSVSNFAATAIRCCFVDTSTGSDAPAMFPSNGCLKRHPLHSAGSFGRVPPPHVTRRRSDYLPSLSPRSLPSLGDTTLASDSLPPARTRSRGHGELVFRFPSRKCRWKRQGLSGSRATLVSLPLFLDPGRTEMREAIAALGAAPACVNNGGSREQRFRGSIARHRDSLSTLRSGGRPPPRKTRFRLLAKLCRAGFVHPQGCMKGFRVRVLPPFSSLPDAMTPISLEER